MMTEFQDVQMDREEVLFEQDSKFLDHCIIAAAALLVVGCGIGMTWCLSLFPVPTLLVSGLLGSGLVGLNVFQMRDRS